jgi:glycosyltransferase involved in cell wall biosynthesis
MSVAFDIVVPTIGRPSLDRLLETLDVQTVPFAGRILVVDDRGDGNTTLHPSHPSRARVDVLRSHGRGPAAARNEGWQAATAPWVAFLDDDVELPETWVAAIEADLRSLPERVGASQGRIRVPLPTGRRPTDWERNVAGLERARWATADMAYRRRALESVGGFDERFPRAYREDSDVAMRVIGAGFDIVTGTREIVHPVRPAGPWVSVRLQAGNADDALMRALHGSGWRQRAGAPPGRRRRHAGVIAMAGLSVASALRSRWRPAALFGAAWALATAELAWARIGPGPRTRSETLTMVLTSVVMPFAAAYHWLGGSIRAFVLTRRRQPSAWDASHPAEG